MAMTLEDLEPNTEYNISTLALSDPRPGYNYGFQIGLRFRYITGMPYTPLSRGVFDSDADSYQYVTGKANSARVEAFHQLDVRIDKDFVFDYWILTAYLDVQNVYFHANAEMSQYNYDYTERTTIRGLPILPSIGMRGAF